MLALVTELSYEYKRCTKKSILFEEIPSSMAQGQEGSSQTSRSSSSKRNRTHNGRMARILLIVQKPAGSRKELFDESKKEQRQGWFKVAYPVNVGTVRWNVVASCAQRATRWRMARQCMRLFWYTIRRTIDPVRTQIQVQGRLLEQRLQGCTNLA